MLTSVPCERAFSLQNALMNSKRNRMGVEHLNNKMLVVSEVHQYAASTSQLTVEAIAEFNGTCEICEGI